MAAFMVSPYGLAMASGGGTQGDVTMKIDLVRGDEGEERKRGKREKRPLEDH